MSKAGFGDILRQTRERKGIDLSAVASRLRVREDILRAIENSDFASMPPRGYARNMIAGYARYLGLDAIQITSQYLDELREYQHRLTPDRDRSGYSSYGQYAQYEPRPQRTSSRGQSYPPRYSSSHSAQRESAANESVRRPRRSSRASQRISSDEDARYSRGRRSQSQRDAGNRQRARARRSNEQKRRVQGSYGPQMPAVYAGQTPRNGRGSGRNSQDGFAAHPNDLPMNNGHLPSIYTDSRGSSSSGSRAKYILAGILLIVLVIILCFVLFGRNSRASQDSVPNMPVTSLDEDASQDQSDAQSQDYPRSFTFTYNVPSGTSTWIQVTIDGQSQEAEVVDGPASRSFDCSGTLNFICANPTGVTATQNDNELTMNATSTGIDLTLSYTDFIQQWANDHPDVSVPSDVLQGNAQSSDNSSNGTTQSSGDSGNQSTNTTSTTDTTNTTSTSSTTSTNTSA